MAIPTPSDTLPLAKRCALHWAKVDAALASGDPLTLRKGYARATFQADIAALEKRLADAPDIDNAYGIALGERDAGKPVLKRRLKQLRAAVQSKLGDTPFAAELPTQPATNAPEAAFLKAFDDAYGLWQRIDAATIPGFDGPLTLARGYGATLFDADIARQRAAFDATRQAILDGETFRAERNGEAKALWERIKQYRSGCVSVLDDGDDLLQSVP